MYALTIQQPYALWIAEGWKTIETRKMRFHYLVGKRIAIHAGKKWNCAAITEADGWLTGTMKYATHARHKKNHDDRYSGVILCTALVLKARKLTAKDSEDALVDCSGGDLWGMFLSDIKKFKEPIPALGRQGAWVWDERSFVDADN